MTATNIFYNFVGFRYSPPANVILYQMAIGVSDTLDTAGIRSLLLRNFIIALSQRLSKLKSTLAENG